jgi:hypothetical protein
LNFGFNDIEGTMSDLDRMTGLKHLRVRGMPQVSLAANLKATGLNIRSSIKNRVKRDEKRKEGKNPSLNRLFGVVREQVLRFWSCFRELSWKLIENHPFGYFMPQTG